jgi:hypothetical protein
VLLNANKVLIFITFNKFTYGRFVNTITLRRNRRLVSVGYRTGVGEVFGNSLKDYFCALINRWRFNLARS